MRGLFHGGTLFEIKQRKEIPVKQNTYFIEHGYVGMYIERANKNLELLFVLRQGEIFPIPGHSLVYDKNAKLRFITLTPISATYVSSAYFEPRALATISHAQDFNQQLQNQLSLALNRIDNMSYRKTYSKLIARLIFFADRFGIQKQEQVILPVPFTYNDIASSIGSTRETVNRLMTKLQNQGLIKVVKRQITINSMEKLSTELKNSL